MTRGISKPDNIRHDGIQAEILGRIDGLDAEGLQFFGILGGALVVLLLSRGKVPESWRRSMIFVLALVIDYMKSKPSPFRVIDTHAGAGLLVARRLPGRRPRPDQGARLRR